MGVRLVDKVNIGAGEPTLSPQFEKVPASPVRVPEVPRTATSPAARRRVEPGSSGSQAWGQPSGSLQASPARMIPGRAALAFQTAPEADRTETQYASGRPK